MSAEAPDKGERDRVKKDLDSNYLIEASAGTGKTTLLVERVIALVRDGGVSVREIAAITFTREASSELRQRFQIELEKAATGEKDPARRDRLDIAVRDRDACYIGTIHAFCAELLREQPVEASLSPGFREVEDDDPELLTLRDRVWNDRLERGEPEVDDAADELAGFGVAPEDLKPTYELLCRYPDVRFPANSDAEPVPDTELRRARETVDNFLANSILRLRGQKDSRFMLTRLEACEKESRQYRPDAPADNAEFLARFAGRFRMPEAAKRRNREAAEVEVAAARTCGDSVWPAVQAWRSFLYPRVVLFASSAEREFRERRRRMQMVSFTDLLILARDMLRDNPSVREDLSRRFSRILVDEFQDTDPIQAEILLYLTGEKTRETDWTRLRPRPGALVVVGDPKQAIYRFRRADLGIYQRFKEHLLRGGREAMLSANFRSVPEICGTVNTAFNRIFVSDGSEIQAGEASLVATRRGGRGAAVMRLVVETTGVEKAGAAAERHAVLVADFVAGEVIEAKRRPSDFLLLSRNRDGLSPYVRELESRGVPAIVRTGSESSEPGAIPAGLLGFAALLEAAASPSDPVPTLGFLRSALCGASDEALLRFHDSHGRFDAISTPPDGSAVEIVAGLSLLREAVRAAGDLPPAAAVSRIAELSGLLAAAAAEPAQESSSAVCIRTLVLARRLSAEGAPFREVVAELTAIVRDAQISATSLAGDADAVRLMTVHSAKGLQAPVVILVDPGQEDSSRAPERHIQRGPEASGFLSVRRREGSGARKSWTVIAEPGGWESMEKLELEAEDAERSRLRYVAATRAEDLLIVGINCHTTKSGGRTIRGQWRSLDPFLEVDLKPLSVSVARPAPAITDLRDAYLIAGGKIRDRKAALVRPTSRIEIATRRGGRAERVDVSGTPGLGPAFGRVMHSLLEALMRRDNAEIRLIAERLGGDETLSAFEIDEAVRLADGIRTSDLWSRARSADERFVEVPFAVPLSREEGPGILRGAMDLVFREGKRWFIVDYKSDRASPAGRDQLVDRYRPQVETYRREWEKFTGAPTKAGLYFLDSGELRWL